MNKNADREKYLKELIETPKLKLDDTFSFKCKGCGNCCKNREDILLTPYDIYRVSKCLKISPFLMLKEYCESYLGQTSKIPIVRLRPKSTLYLFGMRNAPQHKSVCPLLKDNKCIVHKSKPVVCALFPLGRIWNCETNEVSYVLQNTHCGLETEIHTVKDWLADFDIAESEKVFLKWSNFVNDVSKFMREIKKLPDKTKQTIYNVFLVTIYLGYDINKEFQPQFESNIEAFTKSMEITREELK